MQGDRLGMVKGVQQCCLQWHTSFDFFLDPAAALPPFCIKRDKVIEEQCSG